jgi:hypothetical protein
MFDRDDSQECDAGRFRQLTHFLHDGWFEARRGMMDGVVDS